MNIENNKAFLLQHADIELIFWCRVNKNEKLLKNTKQICYFYKELFD
jgi:hypothetical protein